MSSLGLGLSCCSSPVAGQAPFCCQLGFLQRFLRLHRLPFYAFTEHSTFDLTGLARTLKLFCFFFMARFLVRRGPEMILSHRGPSSLNMSSYRPIWIHFSQKSAFFINSILQLLVSGTCPRYIHHRFTIDSP